jgi:ubiquitin carboxyl-terminal hydrolase 5/13
VNEAAVAQLMEMGFPRVRCVKGLLATGNGSADAAMDWLIMHMEDPGKPIRMSGSSRNHKLKPKLLVWLDSKDIDDPLPAAGAKASTNAGPEPSAEQIEQLSMMGFTAAQSKKALRLTVSPQEMKQRNDVPANLFRKQDNNAERAVDWLFAHPDDDGREDDVEMAAVPENQNIGGSSSLPAEYRLKAFISHKGPSVHSGHYVATVRQEDGSWVLFNDEKVVKAEGEANETMKQLAYIYIYERDLQNM